MRVLVARTTVLILALAFAAVSPPRAYAQTTASPNCTASSDAAVQCFVADAVTTGLTQPRYGMTLAQFQAHQVSRSLKTRQTDQTYLVLVGLPGPTADAHRLMNGIWLKQYRRR